MRKRRLIVLLVCCFLLTMAACGGEPSSNGGESIPTKAATKAPEITTAAESAPTPEPTPTPTERPVPVTEIQYVTDGLVALYEADYNTKYGFDAETCAVITAIDEQSTDIAMGVDKALEAKEHLQKIRDIWRNLPDSDQELLYRRYVLEQTDTELADIFHCKPGSIRVKLTRARRRASNLLSRGEE
mgnify:CR=1 FL=1